METLASLGTDSLDDTLIVSNLGLSDHDLIPLIKALHGCTTITHLDISNNSIGLPHIVFLLTSLSGDDTFEALVKVIPRVNFLKYVNISSNRFTYRIYSEFFDALALSARTLTHLDLSSTFLMDKGVKALLKFLPNMEVLDTLLIEQCSLSPFCLKELGLALVLARPLQHLSLAQNQIFVTIAGEADTSLQEEFFSELSNHPNLTILDISQTDINGLSIHLSQLFNTNANNWVQSLILRDNDLGNIGAQHIGRLLSNSNLTALDLENCDIGSYQVT